nr:MAG TPA: hypothetical protein [Caudoviricetes sp.]
MPVWVYKKCLTRNISATWRKEAKAMVKEAEPQETRLFGGEE